MNTNTNTHVHEPKQATTSIAMSASALQTYFKDVLQLQQQQQQQQHRQLIDSQSFVIVSDQHRSHAKHQKRRGDDLLPNGYGGLVRQHSEQRWKVCEDSNSNHLRSSPSMEMIRKTAVSRRRPVSATTSTTFVSSNTTAVRCCPTDSTAMAITNSGRGREATMMTRRSTAADLLQGGSGLKIPQRCESPPPTCRSSSPSISPSELHQFRRNNSSSPLYEQKETMCNHLLQTTSPATNPSSWLQSLSPECSLSSSSSYSSARLESFLKDEDEEKLRYHQKLNVASAHCSCASPLGKTGTRIHVFPHAA